MANNFSFYLLSFLLPNLLVGNLDTCAGAVITSNSANSAACPGEELVYTCVSIGTSQRWLLRREGTVLVELVFTSGQSLGSQSQSLFTFTLTSTNYYNFVSTLSFVATSSLHNIQLECTGLTTPDAVTVQIAGSPTAPQNLQNIVDDYHDYFSTVLFTWEAPTDNARIDYYQYQLVNETFTYNTTNTSAIVSELRYNRNVTFSLLAINCIGSSAPVRQTVNIVGCRELDYYFFNINSSTFSQAPETEILLSCNVAGDENIITITCQDNGQWQPDPNTLMCFLDLQRRYTPQTPSDTSHLKTFLIPIYALAATVAVVLFALTGLTAACVWRGIMAKKRRKREEAFSSGQVNCVYDDIHCCEPVYDTINASDGPTCDMRFPMSINEAYKNVQFKKANFTSLTVDLTNNEGYFASVTGSTLTLMENNGAYQTTACLSHTVATNCDRIPTTRKLQHDGKHPAASSFKNSQLLPECSGDNNYTSQNHGLKQDKLVFEKQQVSKCSYYESVDKRQKGSEQTSSNNSIEETSTYNSRDTLTCEQKVVNSSNS